MMSFSFGLQTANSWTRDNTATNNFLANGGTELNPTSALYDLEFRNYDPILGRMHQVDPMTDKYSSSTPYNYAFNSPVVHNDVNGADPYEYYHPYGSHTQNRPGYTYDDKGTLFQGPIWYSGSNGKYGSMEFDNHDATVLDVIARWDREDEMERDHESGMSDEEYAAKYGSAPTRDDLQAIVNAIDWTDGYLNGSDGDIPRDGYSLNNKYISADRVDGRWLASATTEQIENRYSFVESLFQTSASDQFFSGFASSKNPTDFSHSTDVTGAVLFYVDGVGTSIKESARTFGELRNVVRVAKYFKAAGVVGGVVSLGMEYNDARAHGFSSGDYFKMGQAVVQIGLVFTPVGWGVLAYNGVDFLVGITTGTTVTDRIANGIDNIGK